MPGFSFALDLEKHSDLKRDNLASMDNLPDISWRSFWDVATPEDVAQILTDMFGDDAAKVAAENGLIAKADDREEDFQFWSTVFKILRTTH